METEEQYLARMRAQAEQAQAAWNGQPAAATPAVAYSTDPSVVDSAIAYSTDPPANDSVALASDSPVGNGASGSWDGVEAGPPAPPVQHGASGSWDAPTPPAALNPSAVVPPEQAAQAPVARPAQAGGTPAQPSLLQQQRAQTQATQDKADETARAASIENDIVAEGVNLLGEQQAANYQALAEEAGRKQADLTEAGRQAEKQRAVRTAVADRLAREKAELDKKANAIDIKDRRGFGQRALGALAIGMGAWVDQNNLVAGLMQGMNVQTNQQQQVADQINAAVERDLRMQQENLRNARAGAEAKQSEWAMAQEAVRDVDAQHALATAAIEKRYAASFDKIAKQGLSEQATTIAANTAAQLRAQAAEKEQAAWERRAEKESDREYQLEVQRDNDRRAAAAARNRAPAPMVADLLAKEQNGTITAPEMDMLNKLRKGNAEAKTAEASLGEGQAGSEIPGGLRVVNPRVYKQLSPDQRKNLHNAPGKVDELVSLIDDIVVKREASPVTRGLPYTDANDELEGLGGQLTMKVKEAAEMGALDNGVIAAVKGMAGDATGFRGASTTKLRALKATVLRDAERKLKANGVELSRDTPYESARAGILDSKVRPLE